MLIGGNAYAQMQLPKCVLFGFGNCIGTLRFSNGDIYTGEFNHGKPNGKGAFTYGNGDSYNGTVAEGQRHGSGTYTSAAGDKYVGQFSEGKFDGLGVYYFLADNRSRGDIYVGEFSSNTFNGQGKYTHSNGQVFVGSFANGRKLLAEAAVTVKPEPVVVAAAVKKQIAVETPTVVAVPKVVATPVSVADQVVVQVSAPAAKVDPIPASVETAQQLYASKDSAVKAPLAAESRGSESLDGDYSDSGRIFLKGSVSFINNYQVKQIHETFDLSSSPQDPALSIGIGYMLGQNYGAELGYRYIGKQKINDYPITYKANSYLVGGYFEIPLSYGIGLVGRGGLSRTDHTLSGTSTSTTYVNGVLTSSTSTTTDYSHQKTASYFGVGAWFALNKNHQITFDFTRLSAGLYTNALYDINLDVLDLGWKYHF